MKEKNIRLIELYKLQDLKLSCDEAVESVVKDIINERNLKIQRREIARARGVMGNIINLFK
jgi:hypothetical protein